jgi:peptide/nickel transport system permease protein
MFGIPGMGQMMITAIKARNYPVVQGGVLVAALSLCLLNLIVDILYAFVDPRIRSQYK